MGNVEQTVTTQKDAFRHVEAELYAYPFRKKEIERLRDEILTPFKEEPDDKTVVKGRNSVRMPGDPTGRKALTLASHSKLLHLERVTDAIEEVYYRLPDVKQELIQIKYWTKPHQLTTVGICENLGISERTYRRWRTNIVSDIAEILGWK